MGNFFGEIAHRVGDLVSYPVKASKDLIVHPKKGIKEFEHLYTHNEHEDQQLFQHGFGLGGFVGHKPQESGMIALGTIFGGWAAWGAYGAGAAGGATGAATAGTAGTSLTGAGASTGAASSAAPISAASGTLTPAGVSMGGQAAVDANMSAGAGSETAFGNMFEGFGGSSGSSWLDWGNKAQQISNMTKQTQGQQQQQRQPKLNSGYSVQAPKPQFSSGSQGNFAAPIQTTSELLGGSTAISSPQFQNNF